MQDLNAMVLFAKSFSPSRGFRELTQRSKSKTASSWYATTTRTMGPSSTANGFPVAFGLPLVRERRYASDRSSSR